MLGDRDGAAPPGYDGRMFLIRILWALIRFCLYIVFLVGAGYAGALFYGLPGLGVALLVGFLLCAMSEGTYARRAETDRLIREMRRR